VDETRGEPPNTLLLLLPPLTLPGPRSPGFWHRDASLPPLTLPLPRLPTVHSLPPTPPLRKTASKMGSRSACFLPSLLLLTTLFTLLLDARKQGGLLQYVSSGLVPWWSYLLMGISLLSLLASCISCCCPNIFTRDEKIILTPV